MRLRDNILEKKTFQNPIILNINMKSDVFNIEIDFNLIWQFLHFTIDDFSSKNLILSKSWLLNFSSQPLIIHYIDLM